MAAPTPQEIDKIIETEERAERDIAFVNSLVLDAENKEGTRYKYLFTA